ncbi:MAG TPA: glycosyltransferase family 39 protein, partial [Acidimicrobiales bacterium]|nr:glycosyltransferase family 39 protein [Acidimicrobiales bacterium]
MTDPVAAAPENVAGPADPADALAAEPDAVANVADPIVADPAVADTDVAAESVVADPAVADTDVVANVADPIVADPAVRADSAVTGPAVADSADRVVAGPAAEADRTVRVGRVGGGQGVERERDRDQVDFSALTAFLRRRGIIGPVLVKAPAPALPGPESPVEPPPDDRDVAAAAPTEPRVRFLGVPMPRREVARRYALPVTLAALVALIANTYHLEGVDWGDDFALYMRQAKGLALGNVGEVLSANRFAVENSGWSTFSPYAYPWGWPLIITPVYALFGLDYEAVKVLEVAALCIFLLCFYAIVKRRAGALGATVITLLIGLSPSFVGATDTVLSDIPFLCFVGLTLWWLDRCHERGILEERRRGLMILGLLLAYTVNIRREGIGLLVALVALHLAALGARTRRPDGTRTLQGVDWRAVATPYLTFVGSWVTLHLLLPTVLRPNAPGTGLSNIPHRFKYHQDILAEHVGLKDIGYPISLLGSERAAHNA